ncbi:MAG: glycosyltransferase family 4 protein [Anaerolineae bacterium]|nr:glycosyltransferase family 4 protein [Anaerolineae bacterium]
MKILLVADGRSPITRRWVQGVISLGADVSLISTYPCQPIDGISRLEVLPVAFGALGGSQTLKTPTPQTSSPNLVRSLVSRFRPLFMAGRYYFGPASLKREQVRYLELIEEIKPDLVHAMRIPFEGMLASNTPPAIPLIVSIWGNDLTFHAQGSYLMREQTIRTLERADALMADAGRDIRLAHAWGFSNEKPTALVPGNGGIDLNLIPRRERHVLPFIKHLIPSRAEMVINPRGFRPGSVRNDIFFYAMPLVLERNPDIYFVCPAMAGQPQAESWVRRFKIQDRVRLLPTLPQDQLWDLMSQSQVFASISSHDGTPNSLLEALACGCFPVAGDIESLREWIIPGVNGLLVEPDKPQQVAEAILTALENSDLRRSAYHYNQALIKNRVSIEFVRQQIDQFYRQVIGI